MRRILGVVVLVSILMLASCAEKVKEVPQPEIRVERHETLESAALTVRFFYHTSDNTNPYGCNARVVLDTPEKLQQYKGQVLFLLAQIEEGEKRMKVNEQGK